MAGGMTSIPSRGTKILHAVHHGMAKKNLKKENTQGLGWRSTGKCSVRWGRCIWGAGGSGKVLMRLSSWDAHLAGVEEGGQEGIWTSPREGGTAWKNQEWLACSWEDRSDCGGVQVSEAELETWCSVQGLSLWSSSLGSLRFEKAYSPAWSFRVDLERLRGQDRSQKPSKCSKEWSFQRNHWPWWLNGLALQSGLLWERNISISFKLLLFWVG